MEATENGRYTRPKLSGNNKRGEIERESMRERGIGRERIRVS